jgi:hypothetical protein
MPGGHPRTMKKVSPSPLRDCVTIRHARESGHPGFQIFEKNQKLDSRFRGNDSSFF